MDTSRLLLLILVVVSTSECSEPQCDDFDKESFNLLEGEAFYFVPFTLKSPNVPNEEITWYKNNSKAEYISPNETERIHYHGGALFILNLLTEDSGLYIARHIDPSGKCSNYYVKVDVFKTSQRGNDTLLYGQIKNSELSKKVPCPVKNTCDKFGGNFTWYKDFSRLQGVHVSELRIEKATKEHDGIYTCVCTWTYNHKVYNSSGSRRVQDLECEDYSVQKNKLLEGEAFYFVPYTLKSPNFSNEEITWYKNNSKAEYISPNETERIHYHGGALFILNLLTEDSGLYIARHRFPPGKCSNYYVKVDVFKTSQRGNDTLLYGKIKNSHLSKTISCPVKNTCDKVGGNFTWYKDFSRLQGDHVSELRIEKATKEHDGIYTCVCTWTYNHKVYNSSGSRRLQHLEPSVYRLEILSPTSEEQIVEEGTEIKLNCSVYCGTNAQRMCEASWHVNVSEAAKQTRSYTWVTKLNIEELSKKTTSTAILTIDKVTAEDFQVKFECIGQGFYGMKSTTLTLTRGASVLSLVIRLVCVLLFCGLAALLIKCYAIDLALFFRSCSPRSSHNKDARLYDAYVIYQTQRIDKVTEDTLSRFVTQILPSVLEEKCGYRLFIHGRDDIPGEDRLELVKDCMEESKRLMVILTPGSGSGSEVTDPCPTSPQNSAIGGFDWQVGLHHALVQREMSVILIQLGDMGPKGYTYLPPGLQHLIRKSAPLKWPEGSRGAAWWNSHFWKRVRYLMPATPAKKCLNSAII